MDARPASSLSTPRVDGVALSARLAVLNDQAAAAQEVVGTLLASGLRLPSVYIERAGRLRCLAQRGHWQVRDGISPGDGVIGTTFLSGQPLVVNARASDVDSETAPEVVWQICVPVTNAGHVVGVVHVEGTTPMVDEAPAAVSTAATCLGERLSALAKEPESPGQRLARVVAAMAGLADDRGVASLAIAAAQDLMHMSSAAMVGGSDSPRLAAAAGPLADFFASLGPRQWSTVAGWVAYGSSSCTVAQPDGVGFAGSDWFRDVGAATVAVVPISARQQRLGMLLVASEQARLPATDEVERLEILASQVASCMLNANAMTELRDRAARDPLTGLGHQASFRAALGKALNTRPAGRRAAVVLIDVDHLKQVNDTHGHLAGDRTLVKVARALAAALRDEDALFRIGGDEFAGVARVHDDAEALGVAHRVWLATRGVDSATVSVGVAVAVTGEEAEGLLARADDALYAVKTAGRNGVRLAPAPRIASPPLLPGHLLDPA